MDARGEIEPGRDFVIALVMSLAAGVAIFAMPVSGFPVLHTILNTGIALTTVVVSLQFWDLGWRTRAPLVRALAIIFAVAGVLEVLHVLAALEPSLASEPLNQVLRQLRSGTWAPPAYLLPLGAGLVLWVAAASRASRLLFSLSTVAVAVGMFALFQWLPRYSEPGWFGIIRPTLVPVPLLWIPVGLAFWRRRHEDRIAHAMAYYALITALSHALMLYSDEATSKFAMAAHFGVFAGGLNLLLGLMQMGTADTAQRMRSEQELTASNEALEARVAARTAQLETLNTDLRREVAVRHGAELRALTQVERLALLQRITRAIAERQDLASIFQVAVHSVEQDLPADFVAICTREHAGMLTVSRVGARSETLAQELALTAAARLPIDQDGLDRCVAGQLVHEADLTAVHSPFPERLARAGLKSLVLVPLLVEERSGVFGVLIVARRTVAAFSSDDREFLRQLCDQVSLAANQAQLHESLKQAYEDLRLTQDGMLEQERLRALGQMASGIAHDINNAISPVSLYVESILTHEPRLSERARRQLEIVQHAADDVAHTVARMSEFYRRHPGPLELAPVQLNRVLSEVLELTRARWSDMPMQRGAVIDARVECGADAPAVMAIESEVREALINLVLNATDAMPEGGRLTLRTGFTPDAAKAGARRAFLEVADTGTGMDEATRRRCLEPFFTTKGEQGSGLGLAMVYGIAQRHGLDIQIVTAPGEGTAFRLTFPPDAPAVPSAGRHFPKMPRATRILLIDDDPILLRSLREVLEGDGHQVHTAGGGRVGIDAFRDALKADKPFPVVITDLGMPHVDGRAVAAAIRAASPSTFILMLTGWGQRLAASGEIPPEVSAVLSKPPRINELRRKLAECVGELAEKHSS